MVTLADEAARQLLAAVGDSRELAEAWSSYLSRLLADPLWSVADPSRARIPWRLVRDAARNTPWSRAFSQPGLYLFGSGTGVPLYLGMTRTSLGKRLRGRYVSGPRSQCQLAVDHEQALRERGIDALPDEVRIWYSRSFGRGTARLTGAAHFARHGSEGIWVSLLPIDDAPAVRPLERALIPVASAWNRARGYPALVNRQDV